MICDKCGKSNIQGTTECSYCGAEIPRTSGGGGFADILSYNAIGGIPRSPVKKDIKKYENEKQLEGISEAEMQKLIKKSDGIMKSTKINSLFGLVAIGLCILILISSSIFGILTINTIKAYKEETKTQMEETRKELMEYKSQVDEILGKNNKTTEDNGIKEEKNNSKQNDTNIEDENSTKETDKKEDVKKSSSSETDAEDNLINKKTEE